MRKAAALVFAVGLVACGGEAPLGPETAPSSMVRPSRGPTVSSRAQSTTPMPFKRILCFGDSITYGVTSRAPAGLSTLTAVEGYVPKLARLLSQEYGEGLDLINSGIGAETSTEGMERLGSEIRVFRPDLVLLLHGIIDVNTSQPRFPVVRSNLKEMMHLIIRSGVALIVGTYPPLNPDGFRISGIDNIPRLNDVIRQEAKQQGVPIADHEKAWDMSMQGPDGLHPNDRGYEKMAQTWFEKIKELVEATST